MTKTKNIFICNEFYEDTHTHIYHTVKQMDSCKTMCMFLSFFRAKFWLCKHIYKVNETRANVLNWCKRFETHIWLSEVLGEVLKCFLMWQFTEIYNENMVLKLSIWFTMENTISWRLYTQCDDVSLTFTKISRISNAFDFITKMTLPHCILLVWRIWHSNIYELFTCMSFTFPWIQRFQRAIIMVETIFSPNNSLYSLE